MAAEFNRLEDSHARQRADAAYASSRPADMPAGRRPVERGRSAILQARLVLLVMINLAQLWILSAAIEAALGEEYKQLLPLVIASGVCWAIALTIFLWWRPTSERRTSTGYVRRNGK
jgi:hypothetical protein